MKKTLVLLLVIFVFAMGCSYEESPESKNRKRQKAFSQSEKPVFEERIGIEKLAKWYLLGMGEISIDRTENAVRLSEHEGSKGVMLISPDMYATKNLVVYFKVKPENFETVNVVMHSVSDKDTGGPLKLPSGYDGTFDLWTQQNIQNYLFSFHNAAHESKPTMEKNPGRSLLAVTDTHHVKEGQWHDVEVGREGKKLWMKVDEKTILEGNDTDSEDLPGGSICFRIRGIPDIAASALIKDVIICLQK